MNFTWSTKQWKNPKRFLFKGYGLTIWKMSGMKIPCVNLRLGNLRHIGFDQFHNGCGIAVHLPPVIIINICTKGKIGWWYKKGLFRFRINKFQFEY